ncbi:MAG: DUF4282 domain-containing protein [candidate division WOR-3 bacterium]
MGEFFRFKKMISLTLIKVLYVIGVVVLTVAGLIIMFGGAGYGEGALAFIYGLGVIVLGNLVWRLICEAGILLFALYDEVKSINEKLSK